MAKSTATAANGSRSSGNTSRANNTARNIKSSAATDDKNNSSNTNSSTTNSNNHQHIAHQLLSQAFALPEDVERIFAEKVQRRPLLLRPSTTSQQQQQKQKRRLTDARELRRQRRQEREGLRGKKRQQQQEEEGIGGGSGSGGSKKPRPLSARDKRRLRIYDVPREAQKYAIYEPLHRMWVAYIWEVLGGPSPAPAVTATGGGGGGGGGGFGAGGAGAELSLPVTPAVAAAALCSADFHGAELEVVRARCVSRVGVRGIVVKDTKFTFELVTRRDELKVIPKEHAVFRFEIPLPPGASTRGAQGSATITEAGTAEGTATNGLTSSSYPSQQQQQQRTLIFELHGSQFENRPVDRANKKFKQRNLSDL